VDVYSPNLKRLILPSNIQGIYDGSFESYGQTWKLEELTCYAITPPMVNDNTLSPLPTSCVLLVPEQSVAAYKADKNWSRFKTIKGIQEAEDVTVDLPGNFTDGRYRGMSLELLNAENGESRMSIAASFPVPATLPCCALRRTASSLRPTPCCLTTNPSR
jgi:hypothetical protein